MPVRGFQTTLTANPCDFFLISSVIALNAFAATEPKMQELTRTNSHPSTTEQSKQAHPYVGMWVTADGHIRHELLANGRYDEGRGNRNSAYRGRYVVMGNHIDYWDDTGFTADGEFVDDVLHHAGMILYRSIDG